MPRSYFREGAYRGYEIELRLRRCNRRHEPYRISSGRDAYAFMNELGRQSAEHLYEVMVDAKQQVNGVYLVGKGNCYSCPCDPSDVFRAALVTNSPAFLLVHNHPSGLVDPSQEDYGLMERVSRGAAILGLEFLDSVIIGCERYFSFRENGLMPKQVVEPSTLRR